MNRRLSVRTANNSGRHQFKISTFRGLQQPEMSRKMNRLIKTENAAISAYEKAGRERISIASQLSEWGEGTDDEAVSDISDKLGVLLAEMGDQEDNFAAGLEEYRAMLKHIRDTESSVQPARNQRAKIADEIQKMRWKEPHSPKIETLEQELVRAEAQALVAEAQLTNMTRQKLKESFDVHLAAVIERGEKQILLARHARRLLNCLDDTPLVPGDVRPEYDRASEAKQVLEDAEKDLKSWECTMEPIQTSAGDTSAMTLLPAPAARRTRDMQRVSGVSGVATTEPTVDGGDHVAGGAEHEMMDAEPMADGTDQAMGGTEREMRGTTEQAMQDAQQDTTMATGAGAGAKREMTSTATDTGHDMEEGADDTAVSSSVGDVTESVEDVTRERPGKIPRLAAGVGVGTRTEPSTYTVAVPY